MDGDPFWAEELDTWEVGMPEQTPFRFYPVEPGSEDAADYKAWKEQAGRRESRDFMREMAMREQLIPAEDWED